MLTKEEVERRVAGSYEVPNNVVLSMPTPIVSVRTSVYNHAPYIRECIESVLMQETDFPFEYIIGEDFSTDGTREIVMEYAEKYPHVIRVVTADKNVGAKANGLRCLQAARGKYIAMCEGDDYWTDVNKLQKQVDVLEANPHLSAVVHRAKAIAEDSVWRDEVFPEVPDSGQFTVLDALDHTKMMAPTASLICKPPCGPPPEWTLNCFMGDRILFARLTSVGPIAVLPDIMSVYRRHGGGLATTFQKGKGSLKGLRSRLVYFENIGGIVGDSSDVELKRIEMLRHFTRLYARNCLYLPELTIRERLSGLMDCFFRRAYWKSFVRHGSLLELGRLGGVLVEFVSRFFRKLFRSI
jgi:glycosyltransferase involved in cell wall biosynthesis